MIIPLGRVVMPEFSGIRIMMMPFVLQDPETIPYQQWRAPIAEIVSWNERLHAGDTWGVGFLTIDEALVKAGETHRRPGLHVDGIGAWGGPKPYAAGGMVLLASHFGCIGWNQRMPGPAGDEGDCEHLRSKLDGSRRLEMQPEIAYWCAPGAMHEAVVQPADVRRQLVRVSMPNSCPWHDCYTPNPYGVKPWGPIVSGREEFMAYRP
jgi:hypothetical protein